MGVREPCTIYRTFKVIIHSVKPPHYIYWKMRFKEAGVWAMNTRNLPNIFTMVCYHLFFRQEIENRRWYNEIYIEINDAKVIMHRCVLSFIIYYTHILNEACNINFSNITFAYITYAKLFYAQKFLRNKFAYYNCTETEIGIKMEFLCLQPKT